MRHQLQPLVDARRQFFDGTAHNKICVWPGDIYRSARTTTGSADILGMALIV